MESAAARTCPDCATSLAPMRHEGVDLDHCPAGHGVWLDRGELREVVASEAADRAADEEQAALDASTANVGADVMRDAARGPRTCPVCGSTMRIVEFGGSGIPIDECVQHGVWLDAGELERIEAYAEGLRRTARPGASATTVAGIDVPADLLATLRSVGAPPPTT